MPKWTQDGRRSSAATTAPTTKTATDAVGMASEEEWIDSDEDAAAAVARRRELRRRPGRPAFSGGHFSDGLHPFGQLFCADNFVFGPDMHKGGLCCSWGCTDINELAAVYFAAASAARRRLVCRCFCCSPPSALPRCVFFLNLGCKL